MISFRCFLLVVMFKGEWNFAVGQKGRVKETVLF